jgi:solute carrier family 25 (adenine nucleotide translocator) protein 4/5/6/31
MEASRLYEDLALAGVSAAFVRTLTAPAERVKLALQCQEELVKQGRLQSRYSSTLNCFTQLRSEGAAALWRGNMSSVIRYLPTQALSFAFMELYRDLFDRVEDAQQIRWFLANVASGGLGGASALLFLHPLDYARTRLAADVNAPQRQFSGIADVMRKSYAGEGIKGVYRGFMVSCTGIVLYRGLHIGFYESLKPFALDARIAQANTVDSNSQVQDANTRSTLLRYMALGWGSAVAASFVSYPLDTVRRRIMMTTIAPEKYRSSFHCMTAIIVHEGYAALFRGATINIARNLVNGVALSLFDYVKNEILAVRYPAEALGSIA